MFHIFGGAVNMLQSWSPGELFARDGGWDAEELLEEVLDAAPRRRAPAGLVEMLEQVGGTYTPK